MLGGLGRGVVGGGTRNEMTVPAWRWRDFVMVNEERGAEEEEEADPRPQTCARLLGLGPTISTA